MYFARKNRREFDGKCALKQRKASAVHRAAAAAVVSSSASSSSWESLPGEEQLTRFEIRCKLIILVQLYSAETFSPVSFTTQHAQITGRQFMRAGLMWEVEGEERECTCT